MAWCRRRRDGRWFRLDRITAAWLTGEPFAERDVVEVFGEPPEDAAPVRLG
jgi:predicted DNA-binding transcriptional regulator YafY